MKQFAKLSLFLAGALTVTLSSSATTIDFEAEAMNRGGNLTGIPDSPLSIGIATFFGGELRNGEVGLNADPGGVYASEGLFGSAETNPLEIKFASPVDHFSLLVLNGEDVRSYTVSDNLGDLVVMSLSSTGSLGAAVFSLAGNGITTVNIASANLDAWDFAIDNVTFTPAAAAVPEPATPALVAIAFVIAGLLYWRVREKNCQTEPGTK